MKKFKYIKKFKSHRLLVTKILHHKYGSIDDEKNIFIVTSKLFMIKIIHR